MFMPSRVSGSEELISKRENGWEESGIEVREVPGKKQALSQELSTDSLRALCFNGRTLAKAGQGAAWAGGWAVAEGGRGQPFVEQISMCSSSDSVGASL